MRQPYRPWGERRREAWQAAMRLLAQDLEDDFVVTGAHLVRRMRPAGIAIETARTILGEARGCGVVERLNGDLWRATDYGRQVHPELRGET